jgi:hypothetical protein
MRSRGKENNASQLVVAYIQQQLKALKEEKRRRLVKANATIIFPTLIIKVRAHRGIE